MDGVSCNTVPTRLVQCACIVQFLPFCGDVTISFLAFSLLKRQKQKKNKKKALLFILGIFEVILCSCQIDNFQFLSLIIQGVFEVEASLLTCDSMRCSKEF
jgi:hypothetical protein